jgi:cell division protein FtsQ
MSVRHPPAEGHDFRRSALFGAVLLAAVGATALLWGMATRAEALRFRTLLVNGTLAVVTPDEVRSRVQPHLVGGFLGIDLDALRADLEAMPWVATATVRREWPGTLRVTLREEVPVAVWRDTELLNAAGIAFAPRPATLAEGLPLLAGPDGSAAELLEMHAAMRVALAGTELIPTRVTLSERRAWELELGAGLTVRLGRRDPLPRLERFARVAAPLVAPQRALVAYVDMRYTNGFAVGWRTAAGSPRRTDVTQA